MAVSETMGSKCFCTWDLVKHGCHFWTSLVILSCVGEFAIFVAWILAQGKPFTRINQRYPYPVFNVHIWVLSRSMMAFCNWVNWLNIDSHEKIGEPKSSLDEYDVFLLSVVVLIP